MPDEELVEQAADVFVDLVSDASDVLEGVDRYDLDDRAELPDAAALASLGCGNPTAVADLHPGETVLDLGSGGGIDVILSGKRVGPTGLAYGLDMTDEMLDLARDNATITNVTWLKGFLEDIPLPDQSVDVVISHQPLTRQGHRARGGRPGPAPRWPVRDHRRHRRPRHDRRRMRQCRGMGRLHRRCAHTRTTYEQLLDAVGFTNVEIQETHRVHPSATSAIIRARKPG